MEHDQAKAGVFEPPGRVSEAVRSVFARVRRQFHRFLLVRCFSQLAIWLVLWFGSSLALDRGPVAFGVPELAYGWRLLLLLIAVAGVVWLAANWLVTQFGAHLSDSRIALLIERKFPEFGDGLATLFSPGAALGEGRVSATRQALDERLRSTVEERISAVNVDVLFNRLALRRTTVAALGLAAGLVAFTVWQPEMAETGFRRLVFLDGSQWPRDCRMELVGARIQDETIPESIADGSMLREFVDQTVFVANGARVSLMARAELPETGKPRRRLPVRCQLSYFSADGRRGTLPMNPVAGAREGFQSYVVGGSILDGLTSDLTFYIRGDDHRIGPFFIKATEPPLVTQTNLNVIFPEYMVDDRSSRWTPRTIALVPGMSLPVGTSIELAIETDRDVQHVYLTGRDGELVCDASGDSPLSRRFQVSLGRISGNVQVGVWLRDEHGIYSRGPGRVAIAAIEDKPPVVKFRMRGIGTAVTPGVRIPVNGVVTDDYEVRSSWAQLSTDVAGKIEVPVNVSAHGELGGEVDFLELRRNGQLPTDLPVGEGSQLVFTILANDRCDLAGGPNTGAGERYILDVVAPAELLRQLERQEADQRRRLEQIRDELQQARDNLVRSTGGQQATDTGQEPGEDGDPDHSGSGTIEDVAVRQLFVQRSLLQAQKSIQEMSAMATAFEEIRGQLINNRIDAEERKERIGNSIIVPLRQIAETSLVNWATELTELDSVYRQVPESAVWRESVADRSRRALATAEAVLAEVKSVLDALLKFETQNELLEIVRRMLDEEQQLLQRTRALREQEAFNDLFGK